MKKATTKTGKRTLKQVVIDFMKAEDLKFRAEADVLFLSFGGKTLSYEAVFDTKEDKGIVLFYMFGPVKVPVNKRAIVSEFLTRANYGLQVGNFEMDLEDGEVRYKATLVAEGVVPKAATMKRMMYPAILTMNRYYPYVLEICFGTATPKDAIAAAEAEVREKSEQLRANQLAPARSLRRGVRSER